MSLKICKLNYKGPYNCKADSGNYKYYAGPVAVSDGWWVRAIIKSPGGTTMVDDTWEFVD